MEIKKHWIFLLEKKRWICNPFFGICIFFSALFIIMDALATDPVGVDLREGYKNNIIYIMVATSGSGFLKLVGLCLCTLSASSLYAEDYEENAVYMRVQRLGSSYYAFLRVMYTTISSWLCGFLAEILCGIILFVKYKQTIIPDNPSLWVNSVLLENGNVASFFFIMAGICGFRAVFYALMALAFSIVVPNRKVIVAVPLLLYYFNQYMLPRFSWIPAWCLPSQIYTKGNWISDLLNISEWQGFLFTAGYTGVFIIFVYLLLKHHLYKNGIFGGTWE